MDGMTAREYQVVRDLADGIQPETRGAWKYVKKGYIVRIRGGYRIADGVTVPTYWREPEILEAITGSRQSVTSVADILGARLTPEAKDEIRRTLIGLEQKGLAERAGRFWIKPGTGDLHGRPEAYKLTAKEYRTLTDIMQGKHPGSGIVTHSLIRKGYLIKVRNAIPRINPDKEIPALWGETAVMDAVKSGPKSVTAILRSGGLLDNATGREEIRRTLDSLTAKGLLKKSHRGQWDAWRAAE